MNLILGRQGSGKSTVIYRQIKRSLDRGEENLILIVPEQFTLQAERELIEECELPGIMNVEILSFSRLVNRIMAEIGGGRKTKLSNTGKYMALQKSLLERKEELFVYPGMITKPGFITQLQDVIGNFKKRMISEEELHKIADTSLKDHQMLYRKLKDLTAIYESYNRWLGDDYLDNEGAIIDVIEQMNRSSMIASSRIWIDGFHTFTEQTFRLIERLCSCSMEMTIALTQSMDQRDQDEEIFQINAKTQKRLMEISNDQAKVITCHYKQKQKSQEILHLEKELYAYPSRAYSHEVEDISIAVYKNIYDELDSMAIQLLNLVQEKGYRWKDIHVVTNDLDTYSFLLKRTFEEYEIPFFMDEKRKITDKPLSILLVNTLKAIATNFRYDDVFALIKTGLTDLEFEDYEELENYALKYGIKGKGWKSDFTNLDERDHYDLERLNDSRRAVMDPILELQQKVKENRTYQNITTALFEYMIALHVEEKNHKVINECKEEYEQYEYASEIAQIYNIVINLFDELVEIFGESPVNVRDYLKILEAGLESVDLAIIPSSLDQVMIGDIARSRNSHYKVLFILGANEGKIPAMPSVNGLLNENENQVMRNRGVEIDDDIRFKSIQEKYLFYNVVSKAEELIFISYPLADYEGVSLRPSMLVNRFCEIYPCLRVKDKALQLPLTNARGTMKHMIRHYRNMADGFEADESPLWDEVYRWYQREQAYEKTIDDIKEALAFDNKVAPLKAKQVLALFGDSIRTSVTRLEEYANCPFKHYVTFGLKPKDRKVFEISIPDIGEILHRLIYDYSLILEKDKMEWHNVDEKMQQDICRKVMDQFIVEYRHGILQSNYRYKYMARYVYRLFVRAIETLTYQYKKGRFTVMGNELIFGIGKPIPPIQIELSEKYMLYLEGRIDRVDILEEGEKIYLKVLDFKTGNKDLQLKDVYYGLSLQLLVYMWVCLNYGKKQGKESMAAGMFYFKLEDPMILSGKSDTEAIQREITKSLKLKGLMLKDKDILEALDENIENSDILNYKIKKNGEFSATSKGLIEKEDLEKLITHTEKTIAGIGEEIFEGNISIHPVKTKDKEACTYCNYKSMCFFDQQLSGSKFNLKPELKDEEVLALIEEGTNKMKSENEE